MSIASPREYEVTKEKLRGVMEMLAALDRRPARTVHGRELSRRSLRAFANQLFEELRRYEIENGLEPTPLSTVLHTSNLPGE